MLVFNRCFYSLTLLLLVEVHLGSTSQLMTQLRRLIEYLEEEKRTPFGDGTEEDMRDAYEDVRDDATDTNW